MHYDQNEKLWMFGFFIYAGRDRESRYVPSCMILRNKTNESVSLACHYGVWHLRGFWSYTGQWDDGKEAKDFQNELKLHTGRDSSVKISKSTNNTVIESWWRQLFEGFTWYYRALFFYLIHCLVLDVHDPIHLAALWAAFIAEMQHGVDEHVSIYTNERTVYVYMLQCAVCFQYILFCL